MADVQPNRAMPVHRDILPALCLAGLSPSELKVAIAVLRASWGWSETTTKHRLSQTMIERLTGIKDRRQMRAALAGLRLKGVIDLVTDHDPKGHKPAEWSIAKDYDSWEVPAFDVPWRQASREDPGGCEAPGGTEPPRVEPSEPPGVEASEPPGARTPGHEAQVQAQPEAQENNGRSETAPGEQQVLVNEQDPAPKPVDVVADHYLKRRGQTAKPLAVKGYTLIRNLLRKHPVQALLDVIDWSHDAAGSAHLRVNDRNKDFTRWQTIFGPENFGGYTDEADDWKRAGSVKAVPSKAAALTETDGSARLSYQSWSWFEGELSARAIELGFTPEQVSAAWAKKHKEASNVPSWVFERAVANVRKERT